MILRMIWEDTTERAAVEKALLDWTLYGELHITNANGITVLDPKGITYRPTGSEVQPTLNDPVPAAVGSEK